jgi:hypothetical protein
VLISELLFIEKWDKAVIDFIAATDVGKFPIQTGRGVKACGQWADDCYLVGSP